MSLVLNMKNIRRNLFATNGNICKESTEAFTRMSTNQEAEIFFKGSVFKTEKLVNQINKVLKNGKLLSRETDKEVNMINKELKNFKDLNSNLKSQPFWKKNWVERTIASILGIFYLLMVTYFGLPGFLFNTLLIQTKCFHEVISIAYNSKKLPEIPLFRTLNWYFLIVANYFFYGEAYSQHLGAFKKKYNFIDFFFKYHRFLSFCWYFLGLVWFINLLRKQTIKKQFSLLAWTHFLSIIIVLQSYMVVQNTFEGNIWLIVPLSLVFLNDIFAYLFGKFFGSTPLIELSPKKTAEGFFGGAIATVILGSLLAHILCHFELMVCPTKFVLEGDSIVMTTKCTPSYLFQPTLYTVGVLRIKTYPFVIHAQIFALFASLIAPFGGFCASGFKRAFKVKDFGNTIPGHGGIMDRFDCQYLMATFVNVYVSTFVSSSSVVDNIYSQIMYFSQDDQVNFFHLLSDSLKSQGIV